MIWLKKLRNDFLSHSNSQNKKYFAILSFIFIVYFFICPLNIFAQQTSSTVTKINARILPTVWYSTLLINDGDSIKIYGGIQNNSNTNFAGIATFLVDDKEVSKIPFSSTIDSLNAVFANWVASSGEHTVRITVSTSLPSDKTLVSSESDQSNISIIKKLTPDQVVALGTALSIFSGTNRGASALANKIESFKKPVASPSSNGSVNTLNKTNGVVLGTSTKSTLNSSGLKTNPWDLAFNTFLDLLATLVRNWTWTLSVVVVLFLVYKIRTMYR